MKKKILLLATNDSHLGGHAWSTIKDYDKNRFEVSLVTLYSLYNDKTHAIIHNYYIYRIIDILIRVISNILFFHKINPKFSISKYCYYRIVSFPITAKSILKKYNNGNPDVIILYWHDGFITPTIIRELYDLTKAHIVFKFTDEFPLGGGCHYPCDCEGYKYLCEKCPALIYKKEIASKTLKKKLEELHSIPKIVFAPTAGINQAKMSSLFKENTRYYREYKGVEIPEMSKKECLSYFNLDGSQYIIMFGATYIDEERKGVKYLLEALEIVSKNINQEIIALIPGNLNWKFKDFSNITFKYLGLLSFENLCKAFIASNLYLSPSIADSGPMMVRYSIACGTPVVAFPIGYAIDYIVHEKTGYLSKYQDSIDFANGIMFFYNNRSMQNTFRENCLCLNKDALNSKLAIEMLLPE